MPMENHMNILVERTDSILYYAESDLSKDQGAGWIGGNAPEMHLSFLMIKMTSSTKVTKNITFT
ncbi:hypothetical protein [Paenibacillus lautus]|uniref:hypothetical protein n=1 Tax=Paenibacillus lautus TaxID=1401 RepID=UPI003D2980D0